VDDKRRARINRIAHLLSQVPYEASPVEEIVLPRRQKSGGCIRPDTSLLHYVPDHSATLLKEKSRLKPPGQAVCVVDRGLDNFRDS
jgi:hypothetical protein